MNTLPYPLSRPLRRGIMISLILLFFVICPLLILYTAGYHYSFADRAFTRTGVLSIDVLPKEATVFVRGVQIQKELPLRIQNLSPKTYPVRIEHPGYMSWEKEMDVRANQTTYIKGIELFKQVESTLVYEQKTDEEIFPSPLGEYLMGVETSDQEKNFFLSDMEMRKKIKILTLPVTTDYSVSWAIGSHWLALVIPQEETTVVHLLNATDDRQAVYTIAGKIRHWQWEYSTNPVFFVETSQSLVRLHNGAQIVMQKTPDNLSWYANGSTVYELKDKGTKIEKFTSGKVEQIISLPTPLTKIHHVNDERIIGEGTNQSIIVIKKIENNWQETSIFKDQPKLHYNISTKEWNVFTPWELTTIYEDGRSVLLNRTSEGMQWITALDDNGVILVQTQNKLQAFNPGYYLTHTLFEGELASAGSAPPVVDKKNRIIYFFANIDGRVGLYEREF